MSDIIFYDLEISKTIEEAGGWKNHNNMGLGSAVAYSTNLDRYFFYLHESDKPKLINLLNGNRVVTYNGLNFDSKVLLGEDRLISKSPGGVGIMVESRDHKARWLEFDIYVQILKAQHSIKEAFFAIGKYPTSAKGGLKLDGVASATMGSNNIKTSTGAEAPKMYKAGDYAQLLEYNLQDTILTKKMYEFIKENDFVKDAFGNRIDLFVNKK